MKKRKMRIIPPTQRENKRYLLVKTSRDKIEKTIKDFIGIFGWAKAGPQFFLEDKNWIISIERTWLAQIRTALELNNISVLGVSGTINKLKQKFLKQKV